jgi:CRP-like cAMP-binding protein
LLERHGYSWKNEPVKLDDQQLLKGLTISELNELKKYLEYEEHQPNDIIIQKGSSATHLFFLESGQVSIQDTTDDQRIFTLAIINPGNSFGEMALLDKQKRSANVVAQTDVSCYTMKFEFLDKEEGLVAIKMKILTNLGASLSSRLRSANKELASFT